MVNRRIEDIEGIGKVYGDKLRACGLKDTDSLLSAARTSSKRKALAETSGLTEKQVLKFANMADMYRIKGIGSEYSDLLEASGVDTVMELARRRPDELAKKMTEVNAAKKLTRRVPTEAEVGKWIEQAKSLPRALEY